MTDGLRVDGPAMTLAYSMTVILPGSTTADAVTPLVESSPALKQALEKSAFRFHGAALTTQGIGGTASRTHAPAKPQGGRETSQPVIWTLLN